MICFFINDVKLSTVKYILDTTDETFETTKKDFKSVDYHKYEIFKGYDNVDDDKKLIAFKYDFQKWADEIKNVYLEDNFNYLDVYKYNKISFFVDCFFLKYSKKKIENLKLNSISHIESDMMNKCYNGGINYLQDTTLFNDCYGYDFKSFYPSILANDKLDFKFPIKRGHRKKFNNIEEIKKLHKTKKLNFGFYNIVIKSDHPDILKIFSFSKNNVYTNYDLEFVFRYHKLYKISYELVDCEYNSYIYDNEDLIKSSEIFSNWFNNYNIFKDKLPKNKIVKHLASSLWGSLTAYKRQYITKEQLIKREFEIGKKSDDTKQYYIERYDDDYKIVIINKNDCFKNPLARIKSFLTAFGRRYIRQIIIDNKLYKNVVKIQTDGIILDKKFEFSNDVYNPISEDKSTGSLYFVSINEVYHQCNGENCENFFKFKNEKFCDICKFKK